jgi:plastocyanin
VAAGTTVRWENGGLAAHTATSNTGVWDSGNLTPAYMSGGYLYTGGAYQRAFATPGTYPYHCNYHSGQGMQGTITVTP